MAIDSVEKTQKLLSDLANIKTDARFRQYVIDNKVPQELVDAELRRRKAERDQNLSNRQQQVDSRNMWSKTKRQT